MTIICNNCAAVALYQDLGMRFDSPTIALQILPEDYTKFCLNLKHYMECELKEYKELSEADMIKFKRLFNQPPYFPVGIVDDVMICFQHYSSFEEAKEKWDRRKARIDYDHIGYMMVLNHKYFSEAEEFGNAGLPNSVLCINGYTVCASCEQHMYVLKGKEEFLQRSIDGKRLYEQGFDAKAYARRL